MARCPECGARLQVAEDIQRWDRIYCGSCNAELEVLSLKPLELEAVYDFDEDDVVTDIDDDSLDDLEDLNFDEDDDDSDEDDDEDSDEDSDW